MPFPPSVGETDRPVVPHAEEDGPYDEDAQEDADDGADGDVGGLEGVAFPEVGVGGLEGVDDCVAGGIAQGVAEGLVASELCRGRLACGAGVRLF